MKSDGASPPTLFFFFKVVLAILGPFHLVSFYTKAFWNVIRIHQFGENWHLNNIKSSSPQAQCISPFTYVFLTFQAIFCCFQCTCIIHLLWNLCLSISHFWYFVSGILFLISTSNWKGPCYVKLKCSISIEKSKTRVSLFYFGPPFSQEVLQMAIPLCLAK